MAVLRALHRWLGLLLAAAVVAVAASGGLLLLRGPYYRAVYPKFGSPVTQAQAAARAKILTALESRWRDEGVRLVKFPTPGMNVFQVWLGDGTEAFVDPSTGAEIDRWRWYERVPAFLFELHAHLASEPGGTIVNGVAALSLVFMALTGLIFWWPARRGAFRLRGAVPRRTTPGDLVRSHAAVGVLAAVPIVVAAGTGAAIVFYDEAATVMSRLLDARPADHPNARVPPLDSPPRPWSQILPTLDETFPDGKTVFYYPGSADNARLLFRKRLPGEWHPNGRSYIAIDPYSGDVVQAIDARAQGLGTRVMHAVYPVHAAKVGGLPMVTLAAGAALALTWLAVSGAWSFAARRQAADSKRLAVDTASMHAPALSRDAVRLSDLPVGFTARLYGMQLDAESRSHLRALGLTDASPLRVCKQGEPCVVQVRATRLGISSRIAQHVFVIPFGHEETGEKRWR